MQRKLFRSMTALSATAAVFALLLLAAGPAGAPTTMPAPAGIALASADADVIAAEPAADAVEAGEPALDAADTVSAARQRHHLHRARNLLALPYFSFAQGLRHGRS